MQDYILVACGRLLYGTDCPDQQGRRTQNGHFTSRFRGPVAWDPLYSSRLQLHVRCQPQALPRLTWVSRPFGPDGPLDRSPAPIDRRQGKFTAGRENSRHCLAAFRVDVVISSSEDDDSEAQRPPPHGRRAVSFGCFGLSG